MTHAIIIKTIIIIKKINCKRHSNLRRKSAHHKRHLKKSIIKIKTKSLLIIKSGKIIDMNFNSCGEPHRSSSGGGGGKECNFVYFYDDNKQSI